MVMLAALGVHFKLKQIYNTLVHSYQASTEKRDDLAQYLGHDASASIVTHIGGMVNRHILSETLVKQKKNFQRRALPPTLRQVSVMARLKSNEATEHGLLMGVRKFMSGHMFREVIQVLVAVHFFIIAYNTEPVEQGYGDGKAWVAEIVFAGIALAIEFATHFVVWRGKACFHLSPFVEVPDRMVNAPLNTAASIHPSSSRRHLLDSVSGSTEAGLNGEKLKQVSPPNTSTATITSVVTGSGMEKEVIEASPAPGDAAAHMETHTACSIWACFGWRGGDFAAAGAGGCCRCLDGVPPQAVVGAWRSLDLLLMLVVLACAIATGLVSGGLKREVVHSIQGVVILRLWPLLRCPFPPAVGHDDLHDVDGATVHHAPLDKHTREAVMQATLMLLRGQNPNEGSFEARALLAGTTNDDSEEENVVGLHDHKATEKLNGGKTDKQGTIEEEKDEDMSSDEGDDSNADGIANVGVAMALRDACTSYPELVHIHGALSAPILRAMLGLDPYKDAKQDDGRALSVAARAVALARGLNRSDATAYGAASDVDGGATRMRRQSSAAVAPSPPPSSSASSSDMSDEGSDDGGGGGRGRKASGVSQTGGGRGRLSSFLGGGRHRDQQREQQQQQLQQQQQQQQLLLYQQQMQFQLMQQQQLKELQYQQYSLGQQQGTMASLEAGTAYVERPPSNQSLDQSQLGMLRSEHRGDFTPAGSVSGFSQGWIGSAAPAMTFIPRPMHLDAAASAPALSSNSRASMRSATGARKTRSRSNRRRPSAAAPSDPSGGVMAAAVEDLERPVLPSFASDTGSQHGHAGAGRVPFSSGRSVPHASGHRSSRRGTPARPTRGSAAAAAAAAASSSSAEPALAAPEDYLTGRGFSGGIDEAEVEVSVSDGTEKGSGASVTGENSSTPSAYAGQTTFQRKGSHAE